MVVIAAMPIALGPATSTVTRLLGGEPEHKCMCGMKRGECGCPDCEKLEAQRRADHREHTYAMIRSGCEDDEGFVRAPPIPVAVPLRDAVLVMPAPSETVFIVSIAALESQLSREPSTPPPRG